MNEKENHPSVRAKMDLPFYAEGTGSPSLWSAADHNRGVALLRAFSNMTLEHGETSQVIYSDLNVRIVIGNS